MAYNVPAVAGVPGLLGGLTSASLSLQTLATADGNYGGLPLGQQWGIFLNGAPIITTGVNCDSVISIQFKHEWIIADFPIEGGQFQSYDKVMRPWDVRFRFSAGGSEQNRAALLKQVKSIAGDFNQYDFISPEDVYDNVSISHYDYSRSATNGVGMVTVDVWGWQIIVGGGTGLNNGQAPSSSDPVNGGAVQPLTPNSINDPAYVAASNAANASPNTSGNVNIGGGSNTPNP